MKKPTLLSALAVAVIATASLALPATASASSFRHEEVKKVHGDGHRGHDVDRRYIERRRDSRHHGQTRWAPPRHYRQHGYGHRHGHRYGHRPIERYRHHHDDVRLRLFYDLHL